MDPCNKQKPLFIWEGKGSNVGFHAQALECPEDDYITLLYANFYLLYFVYTSTFRSSGFHPKGWSWMILPSWSPKIIGTAPQTESSFITTKSSLVEIVFRIFFQPCPWSKSKAMSHFCGNCNKRNKHETATENLWLPLWLDPKNIPIKHPGGMTGRLGNGTVDASEIPNNQPGMYKTPVNNGIFTISTGDSPDFFHQHYHISLDPSH